MSHAAARDGNAHEPRQPLGAAQRRDMAKGYSKDDPMALLRILAGMFFLFAALALASDVTRAMYGNPFTMTSFAAHWNAFAPQMLLSARKAIQGLHPFLWDPLIWRPLLLPAWFLLGAVGLLFAHLGRRQRRVNIFIN
jgi:hypothetical protein